VGGRAVGDAGAGRGAWRSGNILRATVGSNSATPISITAGQWPSGAYVGGPSRAGLYEGVYASAVLGPPPSSGGVGVEPGGDVGRAHGRERPGNGSNGPGLEPWASTVPLHAAPTACQDRAPGRYPWVDIALAVMAAVLHLQAVERALDRDWQRVAFAGTVGLGFFCQIFIRRRLHQESARRREGA